MQKHTSKKWSLAGAKGFEPPIYSLGGCRHIRARPRAHDEFPEHGMKQYCKTAFQVKGEVSIIPS